MHKNWADEGDSDDGGHDVDGGQPVGDDGESQQNSRNRSLPIENKVEEMVSNRRDEPNRGGSSHRNEPVMIPANGPYVAFVTNLPFSADVNFIGNYFFNGGCDVEDVKLKIDEFGKFRYRIVYRAYLMLVKISESFSKSEYLIYCC